MKKSQIILMVAAIFLLTGLFHFQNAEGAVRSPLLYTYAIAGKDQQGAYKGTAKLIYEPGTRKIATIQREIKYENGAIESSAGTGTIQNNILTLRIDNTRQPPSDLLKPVALIHPLQTLPHIAATLSGSGSMKPDFSKARLYLKQFRNEKPSIGMEDWSLQSKKAVFQTSQQKIKMNKNTWAAVPLTIKKPCVAYVRVHGRTIPRGLFLPQGKRLPKLSPLDEYDSSTPPLNRSPENPQALPSAFAKDSGAVWTRSFSAGDVGKAWQLALFADRGIAQQDFDIDVSIFDWGDPPFPICDPWVDIDITPHNAAVNEPITITVNSRAFSGLDMYWWYGSDTHIVNLDKAHITGGNGDQDGTHSWTITIDTPGTYTFGANARDLLYWSQHGVPHQASEGCGLAYDTVTVLPNIRKAYTVAFIVLAPQGTDISGAAFQSNLRKIEDIKQQLVSQFDRSTLGKGAVDVSYPTVVLTPAGPVYGIDQEGLMWPFLQQTIANDFYGAHPDIFDFLAVYEAYPDKRIGSRHETVKTLVAGFNIYPKDTTSQWGSAGKLQGIGLVKDVNELPLNYDFMNSEMHLLLHEVFGHQWGMYADYLSSGIHFNIGIESPTFTVLYGRPWRKIDETHFTTENVQDPVTGTFLVTFHPWVLYVAGMLNRNEIPEVLMNVNPDIPPAHRYDLVTTTGTYTNITLQSVIDACGDRYDVVW